MNKFEIASIIIGFILLFVDTIHMEGNLTEKKVMWVMVRDIISKIIYATMIILPLYFNYWKK